MACTEMGSAKQGNIRMRAFKEIADDAQETLDQMKSISLRLHGLAALTEYPILHAWVWPGNTCVVMASSEEEARETFKLEYPNLYDSLKALQPTKVLIPEAFAC